MYEELIEKLPLFAGLPHVGETLACLTPREEEYAKGAYILAAGDRCKKVGILLSGGADIVKDDANGNPVTVARLGEGDMFAEAFAFAGLALTVSVYAVRSSRVLWLDADKMLSGKNERLAANALRLFARKNVFLTERIEHLSRHTLAEKVLSCLHSAKRAAGKEVFTLPFDRQGMADYLGCDRSALSAVLSKLKRQGKLDYHKNVFRLL